MYREIRSYANSIWDDNNNNNKMKNEHDDRTYQVENIESYRTRRVSAVCIMTVDPCPQMCPVVQCVCVCVFKENLNASRPSEHPQVRGGDVKTFRWDHRLLYDKPTAKIPTLTF